MEKMVWGIIILILHLPLLFYGLCFQCNWIAAEQVTSMLMKALVDCLGHAV